MSMKIWLTVPVVALALAGCGEKSDDDGAPRSGGSGPTLAGEYVVTAVTDGDKPHALVKGSEIRLTFADGSLGMRAGCNSMSGDYELEGDRLTVGPIGGTEMGCAPALMEQDTWLVGLFAAPVTVGEDPLTLTAGDVVLTLADRESVSPDRPLEGTRWILDGVIEGESVSSVPAGPDVVLTISEGSAGITGLCNGWGAEVEVAPDEESVTWTPGMRTLIACEDTARQQLDTTVSGFLAGSTTYGIEERTLTLSHGDQGLVFRAE